MPNKLCYECYTIYLYTKKKHIQAKKILKKIFTVSKWRPNYRFSFCVISILAKIWKTTFTKEFFNEIWLIIGDYEYIYNTNIKMEKFYSCETLGAKQFFANPPANLCKLARKRLGRFEIFWVKRSVSMRVTITKNIGQNFWRDSGEICEKRLWGPMDPPPPVT